MAFALFALCVSALYGVLGATMRRGEQARDRGSALLLAQSLLAQLRATPTPWPRERAGELSGDSWQIHVEAFDAGADENYPWGAFAVTVAVRPHGSASREVTLRSIELGRSVP